MFIEKKLLIPAVAVVLISAAILCAFLLKPIVYGQKNLPPSVEKLEITTKKNPGKTLAIVTKNEMAPVNNAFSAAALENKRLKDNLSWTFGKKQQRGWHLYVLLIQRTIGTEKDADSAEFAESLANWQKNFGLAPTGTLDGETLQKMIKFWQSRRMVNRAYAQPEKLVGAPSTDFFDPLREASLRNVERETYAAYKRMVKAASEDPSLKLKTNGKGELAPEEKYLKIISSFRSREYQDNLRKKSPNSGSAGLAVNSPHFTGRALDIYVGGEPVETKDANRAIQVQSAVYKWMVRNADRFGFYPYFYEPWHWEYVPENLTRAKAQTR